MEKANLLTSFILAFNSDSWDLLEEEDIGVELARYGKKTHEIHKNVFDVLTSKVDQMTDIRPLILDFIEDKEIESPIIMLVLIFMARVFQKFKNKPNNFKDLIIDEMQLIYTKYLYPSIEENGEEWLLESYRYLDNYREQKSKLKNLFH